MELTEKIMETIWASGSGQQSKAENRGEPDQLWKGKEDFFFSQACCGDGPLAEVVLITGYSLVDIA